MSEPIWELLGGGGVVGGPIDYVGDWAAGTTYQPGQVVRYAGVDYLAVNPSTGQVPPLTSPLPISEVCLFDQVLLADAPTIDIQNISQAYKDLRLVVSLRSNQGGTTDHALLRLNNDASATYFALATGWIGSAAFNSYVSNAAVKGAFGMATGASADGGIWGSSEILIPEYASATKKKSWQAYSGSTWSAVLNATWALMYTGLWGPSLTPINRITLSPNGGSLWLAGSRATLYGTLAVGQAPPVTTLAPGGIGTSFPASPANGELFTLVDSLTTPTYAWDFRYVNSITDGYKWVFVGGSPAVIEISTGETVSADFTYRDTPTVGPLFTIPRSGIWVIGTSLYFSAPAACMAAAAVKLGAAATRDDESVFLDLYAGTAVAAAMNSFKRTLVAADVLKVQYRSNSAGTFYHRRLFVTPVRLS